MVYGTYNNSYWAYKPTYSWGASHCMYIGIFPLDYMGLYELYIHTWIIYIYTYWITWGMRLLAFFKVMRSHAFSRQNIIRWKCIVAWRQMFLADLLRCCWRTGFICILQSPRNVKAIENPWSQFCLYICLVVKCCKWGCRLSFLKWSDLLIHISGF